MSWWHIVMAGVIAPMYYVLIRVVLAYGWAEYHERGEQMKSVQSCLPDESHLCALVALKMEAESTNTLLQTALLPRLEDSPPKQVSHERL